MMKKMLFFALFLLILGAANLSAQVRIGGSIQPQAAAVLDLNVDSTATPANKGALALPRVNLTSATMTLNGGTPANGMLIYNTGTTFPAGVYVWITDKWVKADANPLKITVQPKPFSFSRLQNATGDPNGPPTATVANLTVTATGTNIKYQWYEVPQTANGAPAKATGTGNATAAYTPPVTAWGMRSYYCEVTNGTDTLKSNIAQVAIGCGAKTNDNRWLRFMCYNIGAAAPADGALDGITFDSGTTALDTTSTDAKGWLFQWGRLGDGHQWRGSTAMAGPDTITNGTGAVSAKRTGYFITNSNYYTAFNWLYPAYDYLWRNWNDNRFPCPSGWRIPSSSEWGTIYRGGGHYGTPGEATSNTWTWVNKGYAIKPDGTTPTLFLPAAGYRDNTGTFNNVGSSGSYWSSTAASTGAYYLYFGSTRVSPEMSGSRANGFSVRCLAE